MRSYLADQGLDLRVLDRDNRFTEVEKIADELFERVGRVIPVVPVALVATVLGDSIERVWTKLEIKAAVKELIAELESRGAQIYVPRSDDDYAIEVGLRALTLRRVVHEDKGLFRPDPSERDLLAYYANSIAHLSASEATGAASQQRRA